MAFVSLLAAATFSACSNDNDDDEGGATGAITELTIDVEGAGDIDADTVKVVVEDGFVAASVPYPKGKFTLQLPATVDEKYLYTLVWDLSDEVTVSNRSVKVTDDALVYAYKMGKYVGYFRYRTGTQEQEGDCTGFPSYVNGDVTVTGTATEEGESYTYNLRLKKGWNMAYNKSTGESTEITTTAPSGMKWYYKPKE
jgi:hypothetical protein